MTTFADRVKTFNRNLHLNASLPAGVAVMNPFRESEVALQCADAFCEKFYADNHKRRMILGINPGRHGGGLTGVPFTDFRRLRDLDIPVPQGYKSHEISSDFVYRVVATLGGPEAFYKQVYINSVCPLGFVRRSKSGGWVNYNYYDDPALEAAVTPFVVETLHQQIALDCRTDKVVVMGKKNADFLQKLNAEHGFFKEIVAVPHPRFVAQYKRRFMDEYVTEYAAALA